MSYKCKRCGKIEESSIKSFVPGIGNVCHMCDVEIMHPELRRKKMARYIDAGLITQYFDREEWKTPDEKWWPEREIGMIVDSIPEADVKEIVHGEWKTNKLFGFKIFDCSNCGIHIETRWNYCPHCGARMDGGRR